VEDEMSEELQHCPNPTCGDSGSYPERVMRMVPTDDMDEGGWPVPDYVEDWEEVQCEFCYMVENSVFNSKQPKIETVPFDENYKGELP
jgi:hypothetical protein